MVTVNCTERSTARLILHAAERLLFGAGVLLLGLVVGASLHAILMSQVAEERFGETSGSLVFAQAQAQPAAPHQKVDFALWSAKRIAAYEESLFRHFGPPIALMRIRKLGLEAPVLEGSDDLILDRGVGHIAGTALPGEDGNVAVAGHRDGFFRVLKDINLGDEIEVLSASRKDIYAVDQIIIVLPTDVSVLKSSSHRSLTLVTCYPFYFIGSAPKRYIVKALLVRSEAKSPAEPLSNEIAGSRQ
jgi:sortase A